MELSSIGLATTQTSNYISTNPTSSYTNKYYPCVHISRQNMLMKISIFPTCTTVKKGVPKVEKVFEGNYASGGKWNGRSVIGVPCPVGRNS